MDRRGRQGGRDSNSAGFVEYFQWYWSARSVDLSQGGMVVRHQGNVADFSADFIVRIQRFTVSAGPASQESTPRQLALSCIVTVQARLRAADLQRKGGAHSYGAGPPRGVLSDPSTRSSLHYVEYQRMIGERRASLS